MSTPYKYQNQEKVNKTPTTEVAKKSTSFIGESLFNVMQDSSFKGEKKNDKRLIMSERPIVENHSSDIKSQTASLFSTETILTRLGVSEIKHADLSNLV